MKNFNVFVFVLMIINVNSLTWADIKSSDKANEKVNRLVNFQANYVHGLMVFLETISGYQHGSKDLRKSFEGSKYDNAKAGTELGHLKEILETMPSFAYESYPKVRNIGANLRELVIGQSIYASSIDDFSNRIVSYLPKKQHHKLISLMKKYDPIYKTLVWDKTEKRLKSYQANLDNVIDWKKFNSLYAQIITFYNSKWPKENAFTVGLYPVDCERGSVKAESLVNSQTMGVCVGSKKYLKKWDLVVHEMAHTLYNNQSAEFQHKVERYFRNSTSKYAYKAYFYFNEVLATAIGNGWFHQQVHGKLNEKSWYKDKYINTMAKDVMPVLNKYMKNGQGIDRLFVKDYINKFEKNFPEVIYDYHSIFSNMLVFSDSTYYNQYDIKNAIENHFTIRSYSIFDDLKGNEVKEKVEESLGETLIFVLGDSRQERYKKMLEDIDLLRVRKDKIKNMDKHLFEVNSKGKAILILKSLNVLELNNLFKDFYQQKNLKI